MRIAKTGITAAIVLLLSAGVIGQVGGTLPAKFDLEGFAKTPAKSYDDFIGRTVLIEFFAYW